jgi:hypothetical protein
VTQTPAVLVVLELHRVLPEVQSRVLAAVAVDVTSAEYQAQVEPAAVVAVLPAAQDMASQSMARITPAVAVVALLQLLALRRAETVDQD